MPREDLFITTKLNASCNSYKTAKVGIDTSLESLGMDYVDQLLIHEPYSKAEAMYEACIEAYESGMTRAIGISNFKFATYKRFVEVCGVIPAVNQMESHVYYPQFSLQKEMKDYGTIMQAWAPFTQGIKSIFTEPVLMGIVKNMTEQPDRLP